MKKIILSLILIGILKAFVEVPEGWRHAKSLRGGGFVSSAWADALGDTVVVAYKIYTWTEGDSIFIRYSEDNGFSWSNSKLVDTDIDFYIPRITIDVHGNLYMLYERAMSSSEKELKCIFSGDFGNTWTPLLNLQNLNDSEGSDAGAMMYVDSGDTSRIHIVYTADVSQGQSSKPAIFYIYSLDDGQTWSGPYRLRNIWDGDTLIDKCINPKITVVNEQPHIIYTVHCSSGAKIMVHYTGFPTGGSYTYTSSHIMNAYGPYVDSESIAPDPMNPNLIHVIYPQEDNSIIHRRIEYNGAQWVWGNTSYVDPETDNAKFVDFSIDDEKIFVMISYLSSQNMPHYTYSLDNGNTWSPVTWVQIGQMKIPFTVVANRRSRLILYPHQPAGTHMELSFISEDRELLSSTSSATAFNSNRHLVREPNNDNLHLIYTMASDSGDIVWAPSYDGGSTWEPYKIIGHGVHMTPCICLNSSEQIISVVWVNGNKLQYRETGYETSGAWSDIITLELPSGYEPDDPPGDDSNTPGMPSIVVTGTRETQSLYLHVVLRAKKQNESPKLIYLKYDLNQLDQTEVPVEVSDMVIDSEEVFNPSLTYSNVNNRLKLHCVYSKNQRIYYSEFYRISWTPVYQISNIGKVATSPSIEVYGDSLYAVWNEDYYGTGKYEVFRRRKKVTEAYYQWNIEGPELVSINSQSYDSHYPTNSELRFTLWNEEDPTNTDYDAWYRYGNDNPLSFLNTSEQSYFPHSNRYNTGLSVYMYGIWTEKDHLLYRIMSHKRMYVPPPDPRLSYLSYSPESENFPYLIEREGTQTYGNITTDVGSNLIYEFNLDTIYHYTAEIELYFEGGNTRTGKILTSNMAPAPLTFTYNPGQVKTIKFPVKRRFLVDGNKLYLTLKNVIGPKVSLKSIKIYRYENEETGSGGAQSAGLSEPEMPLLKIYPTLAKDKFMLTYTVKSLSSVEISLYDILGRKVSTLLKEKLIAPGTYTAEFKKPHNLKSGVYFLRLKSNGSKEVKKIIFSK